MQAAWPGETPQGPAHLPRTPWVCGLQSNQSHVTVWTWPETVLVWPKAFFYGETWVTNQLENNFSRKDKSEVLGQQWRQTLPHSLSLKNYLLPCKDLKNYKPLAFQKGNLLQHRTPCSGVMSHSEDWASRKQRADNDSHQLLMTAELSSARPAGFGTKMPDKVSPAHTCPGDTEPQDEHVCLF